MSGESTQTIFVAIASYRDRECQWTVKDLFDKAKHPDRIAVGICWQHILGNDDECFRIVTRPAQVRSVCFDARESQGVCWAKGQAQALWENEDCVLTIDSHMRFGPGWDVALIEMLRQCPSAKAILSTYPAAYTPPDERKYSTPHLVASHFDDNRILRFKGRLFEGDRPKRGAFIAGGFIFSSARLYQEVPWDPLVFFYGEEVSLSVRAWTNGWDVFSPHRCVIHHYYGRPDAAKHWDDNQGWSARNLSSIKRILHLLEVGRSNDARITVDLDSKFGLGNTRTLTQFEAFSGVDLKHQRIRTEPF